MELVHYASARTKAGLWLTELVSSVIIRSSRDEKAFTKKKELVQPQNMAKTSHEMSPLP